MRFTSATNLSEFQDAQNSADAERLNYLSESSDPIVRAYVAENSNTPLTTLHLLAQDSEPKVCLYVLRNPKVTDDLCRLLFLHNDPLVKREAMLLALNKYKQGTFELSQKELFAFIKFLDPTVDNLSLAEVMHKINIINDEVTSARRIL